MNKIKYITTISILLLLFIVIPTSFALDNQTALTINDDTGDILTADYYFDGNIENDNGDGSIDNPYKKLTPLRIQSNSVLHLKDGEYDFLSQSKVIDNVTIIGQNSQSTIIKNAWFNAANIFSLNNLTLMNSSISNNGQLNASNVIFKNSINCIYSNKNINLNNCTFSNNTAELGGAIYIKDGVLNIRNSLFTDNTASLFGGAITAISSTVTMDNVTLRNNKAKYYGGAIYSLYGNFTLTNSIFDKNNAKEAGALFADDLSHCIINNNEFTNNYATFAGAIYSISNNVSDSIVENNHFENNTAILENNVLETTTPNMTISNGDYIMIYYTPTFNGTLPSSYDLRVYHQVTPVKDQGGGGNCWAFATIAALESCILKANGMIYDLSEENMKNLMGKYSDYGWDMETNKGGYDDMGVGYLVSWLGPVNESEDEYHPSSLISPVLNSFYHVQNVLYLVRNSPTDNDDIKRAIIKYGGVATSIYWNSNFNKNGNYYYNGNNGSNHAVTIVGWDDNYSRSNFDRNPAGDGAWIIKNSWGCKSGKEGYYYVSYYDSRCAQVGREDITYTFILNDTIKYDKNYQYDIPGKTDVFVNSSSTVWYKNVFNSTDNEYLAAVSTYFQKLTNYTVSIYVNNVLKHTQNGTSDRGYYTINLNQLIPLNVGDIFEVVFKITVDGDAAFPISEKISLNKLFYRENISFLSYDGVTWTDLFNLTWAYSSHTYNSQVACIKAFTVFDVINTTSKLTINTTDVVMIKAEISNQYNCPVTGGYVTFNIDGKTIVVPVKNGVAFAKIMDVPKNYTVKAVYENNGYISSNDTISFETYLINVTVNLTVSNIHNPVNITAKVINQYGYPVNVGTVTFNVEGQNHTVDVINGTACLTYIFKTFGNQKVIATFNEINYYNSSSMEYNFIPVSTIVSGDDTKTYNSIYQFKLLDNYGNPLKNTKITVNISSIQYNLNTDGQGVARLKIVLAPGNYIISITNPICKEVKNQNIKVVKRITENKAITMYYGAGKVYKVKVFDDNGNIVKGLKVTFTINNKKYTRTTDSNGYASLKISLKPAKYTVTAEYKGFKVSNKITVKSTIVSKDIKVKHGKQIKFKVKLLNKKGKIVKNKKIVFKFKGKTYKVKTNKKGIAILKIAKKYKKGTYTISSKYGTLKIKNKIRIV